MNDKTQKAVMRLKQSLRMGGWILGILVFIIVVGATVADSKMHRCTGVYIKIDHDNGLFFLDETDVKSAITGFYGNELVDTPAADIDFAALEENLESNPFIQNAEVYASNKGAVHVDVRQREPLVRIVNNSGVSYYLDVNGDKMPLSSKFTARVVVATGNVENTDTSGALAGLLNLCRFIAADEFWKAQFEQIDVTADGEFELIPKLGNHIIRFGKAEGMETKFHKLMIFYKEVLKNFDAENYRIINLKFDNQIVCTKNIF